MCVLETIVVSKSLFAATKVDFINLDIFLCKHQLEVRNLLLQQILHQTNCSINKLLSGMLECCDLDKI